MNKLHLNLAIGVITALIIYGIYTSCRCIFVEQTDQKPFMIWISSLTDSTYIQKKEFREIVDWRIDYMEKYVIESQKNLDLWLKLLTFILSVLIGFSVFSGLKTRELAKDELAEIRRIKDDIQRVANDSGERLQIIGNQIAQIENTAKHAKSIEDEMTLKLDEIGSMTELKLNSIQSKVIDNAIEKAKEDLQGSGIEAFKNLYYAKALKAGNDKNWEEALRLWNTFIDLDDTNSGAFFKRGFAFSNLEKFHGDQNSLLDKAIADYNEAIRLGHDEPGILNNIGIAYGKKRDFEIALEMYNQGIQILTDKFSGLPSERKRSDTLKLAMLFYNRGRTYLFMENYENALNDTNDAIKVNANYAKAYSQRGKVYTKLGRMEEAAIDIAKARELDPDLASRDDA